MSTCEPTEVEQMLIVVGFLTGVVLLIGFVAIVCIESVRTWDEIRSRKKGSK